MTANTASSSSAGLERQAQARAATREASSITLKGLSKRFGNDAIALDGVDLKIEAGEFFTLLGPSGCGKTTLLRILAGLDVADDGTVEIGGREVTDTPPHRRSVNTVFQSYALFPHLSVRDNIAFGLRMRGIKAAERDRRVDEIATLMKLDALLERRIHQLSGGQRQRIALARALVNEPDVLLLDEPLSALDAGLRGDLQVELKRLQQRLGMTFVFVTHDQEEAMVMSDRIALLDGGKIQQVGTPPQVYERPVNRFVARFIGHDNLFKVRGRDGQRITTSLGELTTESSGDGQLALIRPETLELSAPGSPGVDPGLALNRLPGKVEERFYRGATVEYRLSCGGSDILAEAANSGERLFKVGDAVQIEIYPEDVVLIDE
ncbi:ABC transporter ATP-binding protein [Halotalea alkalilenta]|uniref:Fe3+/spermidine/putrescine ABC transporter ATP-binding protein n=1 Tax=Halotalea alkalilenta TaxID=376489 RepID=A0A172YDY9_9GAMM|nr:ABC transporter ATP-binding protein [Halotalea alkalilenta]ANF57480.1 Fe3+/spermidine/putrescine ABC transporter ATP-binding protein [Halotalea alkalilenta]